ncbi:MAG: sulfatase-like hydrolase/transferase [Acidobacteriota bacterium]|nr:MAG: sulfatase-like hydrolase/transferase [Acidobacteriota bacterium]
MRPRSAGIVLLAALAASGCVEPRPSVLLISIDSLRYDALFAEHDGLSVAPRLAGLARESVLYEHAVSPAPWTTPAMMSILTGLPPLAHAVEEHDRTLAAGLETLAERFRSAGYRTAAYVPAVTLRSEFGFARGFEQFDYESFGHTRLSSPGLSGKVLHRIAGWSDEPFFIWVHLWDPHYNYNPPPTYDAAFRRGSRPASEQVQSLKWIENAVTPEQAEYLQSQYEGEVLYTDRYVGEMLDAVAERGLDERLIVAVVADHGEAFLEHGWLGHTNRLDEVLVHVPLMIRWPARLTPHRVTSVVSTAGLGATLLDLAGLDSEEFGSLNPLPLRDAPQPGQALSQTIRRGCLTSLNTGRFKYVLDHRGCEEALFDLSADPGEGTNLAEADNAGSRERVQQMRRALAERIATAEAAASGARSLPAVSDEQMLEELRALGYIVDGSLEETEKPTPDMSAAPAGVDSFGDVIGAPACPPRGARGCLERLE